MCEVINIITHVDTEPRPYESISDLTFVAYQIRNDLCNYLKNGYFSNVHEMRVDVKISLLGNAKLAKVGQKRLPRN